MSDVGSVTVLFSGDVGPLKSALTDGAAAISSFSSSFADLGDTIETAAGAVPPWTDAMQQAAMAMSAAQDEAIAYNKALDETKNSNEDASSSFKELLEQASALSVGLIGVELSLGALKEFTVDAVAEWASFGNAMANLSTISGVATQTLASWADTADVTGVSADQVVQTLGRMQKQLDTGSTKAVEGFNDAFKNTGITLDQFVAADPSAKLDDLRQAFASSGLSAQDFAKDLNEMGGRAGMAMLPMLTQQAADLQAQMALIHPVTDEDAASAKEYASQIALLKGSFSQLKDEIAQNLVQDAAYWKDLAQGNSVLNGLLSTAVKFSGVGLFQAARNWIRGTDQSDAQLAKGQGYQEETITVTGPPPPTSGEKAAAAKAAAQAAKELETANKDLAASQVALEAADSGVSNSLDAELDKIAANTKAKIANLHTTAAIEVEMQAEANAIGAAIDKYNNQTDTMIRNAVATAAAAAVKKQAALDDKEFAENSKLLDETIANESLTYKDVETATKGYDAAVASLNPTLANSVQAIQDAADAQIQQQQAAAAAKGPIDAVSQANLDEAARLIQATAAIKENEAAIKETIQTWKDWGAAIGSVGSLISSIGFASIGKDISSIGSQVKGVGSDITAISSNFNNMAGNTPGVDAGFSMSGLVGMLGGIAGLGSAVSSVVGIIGNLFAGTPEWQKVQDSIKNQLGVAVSNATAQAIATTETKDNVSRFVAEELNVSGILSDALNSAGGTAEQVWPEINNLMQGWKDGVVSTKDATDQLNSAWQELATSAAAGSTTSLEAMIQMEQRAKQLGESIPDMTSTISSALKTATSGLDAFYQGLADLPDVVGKGGTLTSGGQGTTSLAQGQANEEILGALYNSLAATEGAAQAALDLGQSFTDLKKTLPSGVPMNADYSNAMQMLTLMNNQTFKGAATGAAGLAQTAQGVIEAGGLTQSFTDALSQSAVTLNTQAMSVHGATTATALQAELPLLTQLAQAQAMGMKLSPEAANLLAEAQKANMLPAQDIATQQLTVQKGILAAIRGNGGAVTAGGGMAGGPMIPGLSGGGYTLHDALAVVHAGEVVASPDSMLKTIGDTLAAQIGRILAGASASGSGAVLDIRLTGDTETFGKLMTFSLLKNAGGSAEAVRNVKPRG